MAARVSRRLTTLAVGKLKGVGRYADGDGLYLHVRASGSKCWIFRFRQSGRLQEMGLGSIRDVSLGQAREQVEGLRKQLRDGLNPIAERRAGGAKRASMPSFAEYKDAHIAAIESQWKNDKHRSQWKMTLEVYAAPLHDKPIGDITTSDIYNVLLPIWYTKAETASV